MNAFFEVVVERGPCLVKLLGGSRLSVRGTKFSVSFTVLNGIQGYMRTANKVELIDYARQFLKEKEAAFNVA